MTRKLCNRKRVDKSRPLRRSPRLAAVPLLRAEKRACSIRPLPRIEEVDDNSEEITDEPSDQSVDSVLDAESDSEDFIVHDEELIDESSEQLVDPILDDDFEDFIVHDDEVTDESGKQLVRRFIHAEENSEDIDDAEISSTLIEESDTDAPPVTHILDLNKDVLELILSQCARVPTRAVCRRFYAMCPLSRLSLHVGMCAQRYAAALNLCAKKLTQHYLRPTTNLNRSEATAFKRMVKRNMTMFNIHSLDSLYRHSELLSVWVKESDAHPKPKVEATFRVAALCGSGPVQLRVKHAYRFALDPLYVLGSCKKEEQAKLYMQPLPGNPAGCFRSWPQLKQKIIEDYQRFQMLAKVTQGEKDVKDSLFLTSGK